MKAIAETTGRSLASIKAEVAEKGDLGIVAEVGIQLYVILLAAQILNILSWHSHCLLARPSSLM